MTQRSMARNTLFNLGGQAAPLVVAVVAAPVIIHGLGPERFGILSLAWVLVSSFSIFDFGLGRAATRYVAEAVAMGATERIRPLAWSAVLVQSGLGLIGSALIVVVAPPLVSRVLNIPPELQSEARWSFYVLALSVTPMLTATSFRGVLEAMQRFDLVNLVRAPAGAAIFLLSLVGVLMGWELPAIVGVLVASSGAQVVAYYVLSTKVCPSIGRGPCFDSRAIRDLLGFGSWVMVSNVVGPVLLYVDRLIIARLIGIAAVGYYTAPFEIVTRLQIIPSSLVATLFPAFSAMAVQGEASALKSLVPRVIRYLILVLGPLIALLCLFARDVLQVWLGPTFAQQSTTVIQALAIGVLVNAVAQVFYSLIQGFGRPDLTAKFHLIELPFHVVLVWILVSAYGITGAAIAWAVRVTFDAGLLTWGTYHVAGVSPSALSGARIPQTIGGVALLALVGGAAAHLPGARWTQIALVGTSCGVFATLAWRHLVDPADRDHMMRLFAVRRG